MQTAIAAVDLYATLGVEPTATAEEIAVAFRVHAKELHPDRHPGDAGVAERFKTLTHAYNVLARPESRDAYDRRRTARNTPVSSAPTATTHHPVFRTARRARAAIGIGIGLIVLGTASAVLLAGLDTGDAAKTITLWLVVVKLLACGVLLWGLGSWRLRRLRADARVTAR
ncbi:MAG: J domain-containing protein [Acidimicrobiia bacterium]